jgi:hypothetical protein
MGGSQDPTPVCVGGGWCDRQQLSAVMHARGTVQLSSVRAQILQTPSCNNACTMVINRPEVSTRSGWAKPALHMHVPLLHNTPTPTKCWDSGSMHPNLGRASQD